MPCTQFLLNFQYILWPDIVIGNSSGGYSHDGEYKTLTKILKNSIVKFNKIPDIRSGDKVHAANLTVKWVEGNVEVTDELLGVYQGSRAILAPED